MTLLLQLMWRTVQILQMDRPPPHPPITELGRPELKLAGENCDLNLESAICKAGKRRSSMRH